MAKMLHGHGWIKVSACLPNLGSAGYLYTLYITLLRLQNNPVYCSVEAARPGWRCSLQAPLTVAIEFAVVIVVNQAIWALRLYSYNCIVLFIPPCTNHPSRPPIRDSYINSFTALHYQELWHWPLHFPSLPRILILLSHCPSPPGILILTHSLF